MKAVLISDIHFGKLARCGEFSVPESKLVNETENGIPIKQSLIDLIKIQKPEYMFIVGDVTSTGSPTEFKYCQQLISEISEKCGISIDKTVIGLGNHDVDWNIEQLATSICEKDEIDISSKLGKEILLNYRDLSASVASFHIKQAPFTVKGPVLHCGRTDFENMIVFTLNSAWDSSKDDKIRYGKLCEQQLKWFTEESKKVKSVKKWKVLLMHHHPVDYEWPNPRENKDISSLREGPHLIEKCVENGFDIICHGHRHHPKAFNEMRTGWPQSLTFVCAGSLAVNLDHRGEIPNMVHFLEFNDSGTDKHIVLENFKYSQSGGWKPIKEFNSITPIDHKMVFCNNPASSIDISNLLDACRVMDDGNFEIQGWDSLPIRLKMLGYTGIKKLVMERYSREYKVRGDVIDGFIGIKRGAHA